MEGLRSRANGEGNPPSDGEIDQVVPAAGVNPKALQTFMSYLDAQRERAEDAARAAGDVLTGARE